MSQIKATVGILLSPEDLKKSEDLIKKTLMSGNKKAIASLKSDLEKMASDATKIASSPVGEYSKKIKDAAAVFLKNVSGVLSSIETGVMKGAGKRVEMMMTVFNKISEAGKRVVVQAVANDEAIVSSAKHAGARKRKITWDDVNAMLGILKAGNSKILAQETAFASMQISADQRRLAKLANQTILATEKMKALQIRAIIEDRKRDRDAAEKKIQEEKRKIDRINTLHVRAIIEDRKRDKDAAERKIQEAKRTADAEIREAKRSADSKTRESRRAAREAERAAADEARRAKKQSYLTDVKNALRNTAAYLPIGMATMYTREGVNRGLSLENSTRQAYAVGSNSGQSGMFSSYKATSDAIYSVAQSAGLASQEVAGLALSIAQAGIPAQDASRVLETMGKTMRLSFGNLDPKLAIQGFNALKNTFFQLEEPSKRAEKALLGVEKAIALANRSASDPKEIIEALTRVGPGANMAGFTAEEVIALLTKGGETAGLSPVALATSLRRTLPRISAPDVTRDILKTLNDAFDAGKLDKKFSPRDEYGSIKTQKQLFLDLAEAYRTLKERGADYHAQQLLISVAGNVQYSNMAAIFQITNQLEEKMQFMAAATADNARVMNESNMSLETSFIRLWNSITNVTQSALSSGEGFDILRASAAAAKDTIDALGAEGTISAVSGMATVVYGLSRAFDETGAAAGIMSAKFAAAMLTLQGLYELYRIGKEFLGTEKVTKDMAASIRSTALPIAQVEEQVGTPITPKKGNIYGTSSTAEIASLEASISSLFSGSLSAKEFAQNAQNILRAAGESDGTIGSVGRALLGKDPEKIEKSIKRISEAISNLSAVSRGNEGMARGYMGSLGADAVIGENKTGDYNIIRGKLSTAHSYLTQQKVRFEESPMGQEQVERKKFSSGFEKITADLKKAIDAYESQKQDFGLEDKDPFAKENIETMKGLREQVKALTIEMTKAIKATESPITAPEQSEFNLLRKRANAINIEISSRGKSLSSTLAREQRKIEREERLTAKEISDSISDFNKAIIKAYGSESDIFGATTGLSASKSIKGQYNMAGNQGFYSSFPSVLDSMSAASMSVPDRVSRDILEKSFDAIFSSLSDNADVPMGSLSMEMTNKLLKHVSGGVGLAGLTLGAGVGLSAYGVSKGAIKDAKGGETLTAAEYEKRMSEASKVEKEGNSFRDKVLEEIARSNKKIEKNTEPSDMQKSAIGALSSLISGGKMNWSSLQDSLFGNSREDIVKHLFSQDIGGMGSLGGFFDAIDVAAKMGINAGSYLDAVGVARHGAGQFAAGMAPGVAMAGAGMPGVSGLTIAATGSGLSKAAGSEMSKQLFSQATQKAIGMLGTALTYYAAFETVVAIAKAAGIGTTRTRVDDRQVAETRNEEIKRRSQEMKDSARSGAYDMQSIISAYGFTPVYDTVTERTEKRKDGLNWVFGGKDKYFESNNAGVKTLEELKQMEYDAIIRSGEQELFFRDKQIDMQIDRLDKMKLIVDLEKKTAGEMKSIASAEIEVLKAKKDLFAASVEAGFAASGKSEYQKNYYDITKKYGRFGTFMDENSPYVKNQALPAMQKSIMDLVEKQQPNRGIWNMDLLPVWGEFLFDPSAKMLNKGIESGSYKQIQDAIFDATMRMSDSSSDAEIALLAKLVDIGNDAISVLDSILGQQIDTSRKTIESSDYLAGIESSRQAMLDAEKSGVSSFSDFIKKISSGDPLSSSDEGWKYRIGAVSGRLNELNKFSGGAFGSDIMSAIYSPSEVEKAINSMKESGASDAAIEYVKSLVTELNSSIINAFSSYSSEIQTTSGLKQLFDEGAIWDMIVEATGVGQVVGNLGKMAQKYSANYLGTLNAGDQGAVLGMMQAKASSIATENNLHGYGGVATLLSGIGSFSGAGNMVAQKALFDGILNQINSISKDDPSRQALLSLVEIGRDSLSVQRSFLDQMDGLRLLSSSTASSIEAQNAQTWKSILSTGVSPTGTYSAWVDHYVDPAMWEIGRKSNIIGGEDFSWRRSELEGVLMPMISDLVGYNVTQRELMSPNSVHNLLQRVSSEEDRTKLHGLMTSANSIISTMIQAYMSDYAAQNPKPAEKDYDRFYSSGSKLASVMGKTDTEQRVAEYYFKFKNAYRYGQSEYDKSAMVGSPFFNGEYWQKVAKNEMISSHAWALNGLETSDARLLDATKLAISGDSRDLEGLAANYAQQYASLGTNFTVEQKDAYTAMIERLTEIVQLSRDLVALQMEGSRKKLGEMDYLSSVESSWKAIADQEKDSGKKMSSFAAMLSGGTTSFAGESWEHRITALKERFGQISEYAPGASLGFSNISDVFSPDKVQQILSMTTGDQQKEYVKGLLNEIAASFSGMFSSYASGTQNSASGGDEESKMFEVGSSGKYYITQNFTVDSTYFGGSQADAVKFLQFLSKAWNDSGSKNTTQRLF